MKHKKTLLIIAFLTLFVFQQVQAGGRETFVGKNLSQINPTSASSPVLADQVYIYLYVLDPGSGKFYQDTPSLCNWNNLTPGTIGCGSTPPIYSPNDYAMSCGNGCYWLDVEDDYLPNVVAIEMGLGELPAVSESLRAQAVAARSHVNWKVRNGPWDNGSGQQTGSWPYINNSSLYAVYSPDYVNSAASTAVQDTENQYLYRIGTCSDGSECHVIDAEFGSDTINSTITEPGGDTPKPYLIGVADPISSTVDSNGNPLPGACHATQNGNIAVTGYEGLLMGMSQRGAIRWASGNQCLSQPSGGESVPWPVNMPSSIKWDYKQILAHYYTGVEFKTDGNEVNFAPNDRWNLLKYNLPSTTATVGASFIVNVTLQNTSAANSDWSDVVIGYRWNDGSWTVLPNSVSSTSLGNPPADLALSIPVLTGLPTSSTLHLDLGHQIDSQTIHWFSEQSPAWPDAQIAVTVNGVSTPTVLPVQLTYTGSSFGCTSYYVDCNAIVDVTQSTPYQLDFDITYFYNKYWNGLGSDFNVDLGFDTNVFDTDIPLYWKITPITSEIMPSRSIITEYSGTPDLPQMDLTGNWLMLGQPWYYHHFRVHFLRSTSAAELFSRTEQWHFTIALYDFEGATPTPSPTATSTCSPWIEWLCNL